MKLRTQDAPAIEVDMVPLIDIVTLLLMFLVIVGDIAKSANAVKVNLPRADQAIKTRPEGLIVVSLQKSDGVYYAVIGKGKRFGIGERGSANLSALSTHLLESAKFMHSKKMCELREDGTYSIPVKLRIGEDVPMKAVEDVLDSVVQARMRDVQYAANPLPLSE